MGRIKTILKTFLLVPVIGLWDKGKGKPIYKLQYTLYFLLWAGSIAMLVFSITNPELGQCKHNLWLSASVILLDLLCFLFMGVLDLKGTDGFLAILICLALPAGGISLAAILINIVRMLFGLGGESPANPVTVPVFMIVLAAAFGGLAVLLLLLVIWEIFLIRGSEIVITNGAFARYRSVVLKNGRERNLELAPKGFLPKNVFEIRTFLKEEERAKTIKEGIYQTELDQNEIVVRRGEKKIFVKKYSNEYVIYVNPRGRQIRALQDG